ncbi:hypothetical protein [Streptomyces sp. NPDC055886]
MSRLLDCDEFGWSASYRLLTLYDTTMGAEQFYDDADRTKWLLPGPGVVFLQTPREVGTVRMRLESWSAEPPPSPGPWAGWEEVEVSFPDGHLGIQTVASGGRDTDLVLPSPGTYRTRWQWAFNPDAGPFTSPLDGSFGQPLDNPGGHEDALNGADQFILVQMCPDAAA